MITSDDSSFSIISSMPHLSKFEVKLDSQISAWYADNNGTLIKGGIFSIDHFSTFFVGTMTETIYWVHKVILQYCIQLSVIIHSLHWSLDITYRRGIINVSLSKHQAAAIIGMDRYTNYVRMVDCSVDSYFEILTTTIICEQCPPQP